MKQYLAARWIAANSVGMLVGMLVGLPLESAKLRNPVLTSITIGAALAMAQWFALRRHVSYWWIPTTAVAGCMGFWLGALTIPHGEWFFGPSPTWAGSVGGLVGGAAGLAQWWLVRRRAAHPWLWVPVSAAAWALGGYALVCAVWAFDSLFRHEYLAVAVTGLISGLISGASSAPALIYMFGATSTVQPVSAARS